MVRSRGRNGRVAQGTRRIQASTVQAEAAGAGNGGELLDMKQAMKLLKTTQPTFYRWLREGRIKGMKAGRQWRFHKDDIERFMRGESPRVDLPADISPLVEALRKQLRLAGARDTLDNDMPAAEATLNLMLRLLVAVNASDMHMEVFQDAALLRYRVDGVLHEMARFDPRLAPVLVDLLKTAAKCSVQERTLPQDGKFVRTISGIDREVIVHILPSAFGETAIVRLLAKAAEIDRITLEGYPFRPEHREIIKRNLDRSHGLIICCGPAGSGKTTLLFGALDHVNRPGRKLLSAEDPIEYYLPGVTQVQVSPREGRTFATVLKSFLRSDPDVIMVGEVRDSEVASLCHTVALTGHLVLTTLFSEDGPASLTRLMDLQVPPFLIADALKLVISQRLVRRICRKCSEPTTPSPDVLEAAMRRTAAGGLAWENLPKKWMRPVGCKECRGLGYRGQLPVNELMEMNSELRAALAKGASTEEFRRVALKQGMVALAAEAIRRAAEGETTLEEALGILPTA